MSTPEPAAVAGLPALVALDAYTVLAGERRGASVQLDDTYFDGQTRVMDAVDTTPRLSKRQDILTQTQDVYEQIQVDFDELTEDTLWTASEKLVDVLQQLPEFQYLNEQFPGKCFILPEWLRTDQGVSYGSRIYFFRRESAPEPIEVVRQNIESVVADEDGEFESYLGRLHGYPECCIESFATDDRTDGRAPELDAIEPVADHVNAPVEGDILDTSTETVVADLFDTETAYSFFAREFFPEPGCVQAQTQGKAIYDRLCETFSETLVEDYFRLNVGWSYLMAQSVAASGNPGRPAPGSLGREHLLFYLPLSVTHAFPRYESGEQ